MTQSIILYICEQHVCLILQTAENEQLRSGAPHPSRMSAQRQLRLAGISRNICLPSTRALPLSTARQLALQLSFGVVRAKLLLYLNNTAPTRTCLQLLDRFWCARTLRQQRNDCGGCATIRKHGEPWYIYNWMCYTQQSLLGPVFFRTAFPCFGGYHMERGEGCRYMMRLG